MPPCLECRRLWNEYTGLKLKYRLCASARREFVGDDLEKRRDACERARRMLEEHERAHNPKSSAPPPAHAPEPPARDSRVILLPAATVDA